MPKNKSKHLPVLSSSLAVLCAAFICSLPCFSVAAEKYSVPLAEKNHLGITLGDAIIMALENNRGLRVQRLTPLIRKTYEQQERAVFDPFFSAGLSSSREKREGTAAGHTGGGASISKFLPSGTELSAGIASERDWSDLYSDRHSSRIGVTVTQALLRGSGLDFNLADVRQAKLDTLASHYELRGFTERLVADVETTYWNYALAREKIEIYRQSMSLAEKQLEEIKERISVGTLAGIELAAARAEVALRREALINSRSNMETIRLRLFRLLNPERGSFPEREIILKNLPAVPDVELDDVSSHAAVAKKMRSDLNHARLALKRGEIDVAKTRNGLLPRMDFFISLGKTGYSDSFGNSFGDIFGDGYDISAGISFAWPLGNRDAEARHERAVLSSRLAEEALENLLQLVELDVRLAYIQVNRASQQIEATSATLRLQAEKLRAETEKFHVGRSTALLVAQSQRDLLDARISEVEAVVNYLNSLVELFRIEGSLLERRGISTGTF